MVTFFQLLLIQFLLIPIVYSTPVLQLSPFSLTWTAAHSFISICLSCLYRFTFPAVTLSVLVVCVCVIGGVCVCRCRPACLIPVVTCWLPVKSILIFFSFSMFTERASVISSCLHQFPFCYLRDALLTPRSCLLILHTFMSSTLKPEWEKWMERHRAETVNMGTSVPRSARKLLHFWTHKFKLFNLLFFVHVSD